MTTGALKSQVDVTQHTERAEIIADPEALEAEIVTGVVELEAMLGP